MIRWALSIVLMLPPIGAVAGQTSAPASSIATPSSRVAITARAVAVGDRAALAYEAPSGHILFRVKIAGKDSWGLLDTGASASVLDVNFAKAAGLSPTPDDRPVQVSGGIMARSLVNDVSVLLPGQMEIEYERMPATDLRLLRVAAQRPVDFILGADLLSRFFVVVDPDKQVLRFAPSGLFKPPPHFHAIALQNGKAQFEMRVGDQPLLVTIDTGKDGGLDVQPELWDRYVPASLPVRAASQMALDGKRTPTKKAVVPRVDIGPVSLSDVEITQRALPQSWGQGSIGMGILSRFRFVIDIEARTMWFTPRNPAQPASAPPNIGKSGGGN